MRDIDELLKAVPTDETRALGFRDIHRRFGKWSPTFVRYRLNELVASGRINKKIGPWTNQVGTINLYYVPKK